MGRQEDIVPVPEGSDVNHIDRNGQSCYPEFIPDLSLEEVPDTPETRAHHRRVIKAIQDRAAAGRDERVIEPKASDDQSAHLPRETGG